MLGICVLCSHPMNDMCAHTKYVRASCPSCRAQRHMYTQTLQCTPQSLRSSALHRLSDQVHSTASLIKCTPQALTHLMREIIASRCSFHLGSMRDTRMCSCISLIATSSPAGTQKRAFLMCGPNIIQFLMCELN